MTYLHWLLALSGLFFLLERLWPARPAQPALRPGLGRDLFYLLFNGHYFAVLTGSLVALLAGWTRSELTTRDLLPEHGLLDAAPLWLAGLAYFVVSDLLQWCTHVALHKVPALWRIHRVHHSVVDMDWAGSFRFHWLELVVYRSVLYVPLALIGGKLDALFPVWIFATFWGHLNHSNLRIELGPLGRVLNSPRMHLWHHDASAEGGTSKNYGIVLSLWDWLFGTAYWPRDRSPRALGFPGLDRLPPSLLGQQTWPLLPLAAPQANADEEAP